jgi:isoleucyl-tRNA synthetase
LEQASDFRLQEGASNPDSEVRSPKSEASYEARDLKPEYLATAKNYRPVKERAELDRWIIGEMHTMTKTVVTAMDAYDHYNACASISQFVDALSNWYVRRSRDRFWSGEESGSKADAYWTLYESLVTLAKLIAPFVPFLAEEMWQQLVVDAFNPVTALRSVPGCQCASGQKVAESVHLCDYPVADETLIDTRLSREMALARDIVSLGRNARMGAQLKVRQPLQSVEIVLVDPKQKAAVERQVELIKQELNVKQVELIEKADKYIAYTVVPDFKKLGPKLGKQLPEVKKALSDADGGVLLAEMERNGKVTLNVPSGAVELGPDEVQIRLQAKEGWAAAHSPQCVVILSTELTDELLAEGRARELVRLIQDRRKELDCAYTDRIHVGIVTDSAKLLEAAVMFAATIQNETLAVTLSTFALDDIEPVTLRADGDELQLYVGV